MHSRLVSLVAVGSRRPIAAALRDRRLWQGHVPGTTFTASLVCGLIFRGRRGIRVEVRGNELEGESLTVCAGVASLQSRRSASLSGRRQLEANETERCTGAEVGLPRSGRTADIIDRRSHAFEPIRQNALGGAAHGDGGRRGVRAGDWLPPGHGGGLEGSSSVTDGPAQHHPGR